jgi:hypothetical protein
MKRAASILLVLFATHASADREPLADRDVLIAGFGLVWMQVDGTLQSGMAVQPTYNHTFDRFELQGDYMLADLRDDDEQMPGGNLHRFGFAARYQAARARVKRSMTLDFVVEAGAGLQYIELDDGSAVGRTDFSVGLGFRMLADLSARKRAFMGMEGMARLIVTPGGDTGFFFGFGAPFGK